MRPIYLDYNATTPVAPEAVEAMLPYLREHFGNPSSAHGYGAAARDAVAAARRAVADLLGADPGAILFTSSGTESNNLAIEGLARASRDGRNHLVTSAIEHPAVVEVFRWLATLGMRVSTLPVDEHGRVRPEDLEREIGPDTLLVSVMHANNEVGTIQPIAELAAIAHLHGALLHTDAAQSVGKIPVAVDLLGVDLLTVAGHKIYAPKGIGALYVRPGVRLAPVLHGAAHENGTRPGTEAVAQIVALAEAGRIAARSLASETSRLRSLRDRLEERLRKELGRGAMRTNGHPEHRLPNTASVSFRGVRADALLAAVSARVAASAGSACHAHDVRLSPVLRAMGIAPEWGMGTVRLSVGRYTTEAEVDEAVGIIAAAVRAHAPASAVAAPGPT
ncbi:MAG TPA: cysteine desulfurase family protein [Longimicrobiales bacterium]|nr:cysteine desulfurase family protein [Longimicrobiales bacterium]